MKELLIINDYDTQEAFEYILTDNANACKQVLQKFEQERFDNDNLEWEDYYKMLDEKGIKYEVINTIKSYAY